MGIMLILWSLLLIVPGIYFAFAYALTAPIVLLEEERHFGALKRSVALAKGSVGKIFVLFLVLGIIASMCSAVGNFIPFDSVSLALSLAVSAFFRLVDSIATVVLYFSCRCKHEAFDLQLAAADVAE